MKRLAALLLTCTVLLPAQATATEGCVTHAEYDNLFRGLSVGQVAGRFDTNGVYLGSGPERFRRGYDACWTNDRRVVVWYDLDTGLSDDWALRDY